MPALGPCCCGGGGGGTHSCGNCAINLPDQLFLTDNHGTTTLTYDPNGYGVGRPAWTGSRLAGGISGTSVPGCGDAVTVTTRIRYFFFCNWANSHPGFSTGIVIVADYEGCSASGPRLAYAVAADTSGVTYGLNDYYTGGTCVPFDRTLTSTATVPSGEDEVWPAGTILTVTD